MLDREHVRTGIYEYIVRELMDGESDDLQDDSPLLAWGVLNSLEIVRLRDFIQRRFQLDVGDEDANPRNFETIDAITNLVLRLTNTARREPVGGSRSHTTEQQSSFEE